MQHLDEYKLSVTGLFGRNRKVKFESFTIHECAAGSEVSESFIKELADKKMAEIKVKSGRVRVLIYPVTVETFQGIEMKSTTISLAGQKVALDLGTI